VINTSGTLNAALKATDPDGEAFELHLSTHLPGDVWIVEVRRREGARVEAVFDAEAGTRFRLPSRGAATLLTPYRRAERATPGHTRLWLAALELPAPLPEYLTRHGFPIRYSYVGQQWPISAYQTVYVTEMGSAEMPSAGRAFTPELLTRLMAQGVTIAPLLLHTGIASLEDHEPPHEEVYRVSPQTARLVTAAREGGQRILAVGTTAVRTLQTVTDADGVTHPGEGWTNIVVTPETGARSVDGLLTGLHEPRSTHRLMLEAIASPHHLRAAYEAALAERYLWHEFGDLHLILP
jgi:S-adenosylmethionine:tRNA ribosyltransferase-isomerase